MSFNYKCTFCLKKGIKGPHNHKIRDFSKKGNPITCPELINLTCNYCKCKGHTVNYCKILKEKKIHFEKQEYIVNPKKREYNITYDSEKIQKLNNFNAMFHSLNVQDNEDSNEHSNEHSNEDSNEHSNEDFNKDSNKQKVKTWANVTALNRPPVTNNDIDTKKKPSDSNINVKNFEDDNDYQDDNDFDNTYYY